MVLLQLTKLLDQCLSEVLNVVTELLRRMLVGLNQNTGNPLVQSQLNVKWYDTRTQRLKYQTVVNVNALRRTEPGLMSLSAGR